MVMQEHAEWKKYLNRAVFNDWGLYGFVQMLIYKCLLYGSAAGREPKLNNVGISAKK
jgi:transposase